MDVILSAATSKRHELIRELVGHSLVSGTQTVNDVRQF
jgi:hypothetical protein